VSSGWLVSQEKVNFLQFYRKVHNNGHRKRSKVDMLCKNFSKVEVEGKVFADVA